MICLVFLGSCGEGTVGKDKNEQPLAQAAGQYLYPSTIAGIGTGMTEKDSLYQLKVYTEQWIRDQLMLDVANNNVTTTTQIERMVQAYKATLIMNEYEEALINQRLNTEVTPQELANYYSNNKEQYQAGISWVRCHFVKVKRGTAELQKLKKWFKSDAGVDFERVKLFCAQHKTVHILNEDLWIEYDKLVKEFPKDAIGSRHRKKQAILDRMDENYQYLLQIFEYRDKEDAAPLPQVQDEIKRIVLHQRRNKILQNLRKEVYEKAKKEGTFEIY
ncbi:MAG: hypothetical protein JKY03_04955 [Aureispira sp.]|nr:hypothetical protein [Aureispira sp.]